MKKIELNTDGTLNILDESKFYVLQVYFNNAVEPYFYACKRTISNSYEFVRMKTNTNHNNDSAFPNHTLQESVFCAIKAARSDYTSSYWKGNVYQFDSVKEFEDVFNVKFNH